MPDFVRLLANLSDRFVRSDHFSEESIKEEKFNFEKKKIFENFVENFFVGKISNNFNVQKNVPENFFLFLLEKNSERIPQNFFNLFDFFFPKS